MKKIILIRHGSIDSKYDGCYIGSLDVALSEKGFREAAAIGRYIAETDSDHIFASPMLRVRQTLENALPLERVKLVKYRENLRETNFGDWEGKTFSQIREQYPDETSRWAEASDDFNFPNGSNPADFYRKIELFKKELVDISGSTVILFTHGGVILSLICSVLGIGREKMTAFKVDRGSVSQLELFENGYGRLTGININPEDY